MAKRKPRVGEWVVSPPKADAPCASYFGNMCGGFGGKMICMGCGWDWSDHRAKVVGAYVPGARVQVRVLGEWANATIEAFGLLDTWLVRLDTPVGVGIGPPVSLLFRGEEDLRLLQVPEIHWRADDPAHA